MKEFFEHDEEIRRIVRKEGLLKPSTDFTSRVMQFIEENKEQIFVYKPLLSKRAWAIITAGIVLFTILSWQFFGGTATDSTLLVYPETLKRLSEFINNIDFSVEFNANALLIVTLAMISMGLLLLIDIWLSNKNKKTAI
jgi:hypothetical protein